MKPASSFLVHDRTLPAIAAAIFLLLLAGGAAIVQNEAAYYQQAEREARVKAEILAASISAALDFDDVIAAQEAVNAVRVDRQVRAVGVYGLSGTLFAGYQRGANMLPPEINESWEPGSAEAELIVAQVPVENMGERLGFVHLAADPEPLSNRIGRILLIGLLMIMALLVIVVLGVGQAALRSANRELKARADALTSANSELQVQVEERHKAEEHLRQAQKMQALGQLTGGIAHDFNNLLTVIQGSAEILRRPKLEEAKRFRYADAVAQASDRAAALTSQLLAFGRRQALQPEVIDINDLVTGMSDLLDRTLGDRIEVRTELHCDHCLVEADRAQLESAVLNLAVNARDAMPEGGRLTVITAPVEENGTLMVALTVRDAGTGMDAETLGRVLEPFFTTKAPGQGTGLGLSQVYGFATQSGGDLRIESTPGEGSAVTILLPKSVGEISQQKPCNEAQSSRRSGTILLVEDNDEVAAFAEDLLRELGYSVARASNGNEAIAQVEQCDFDLIFSDVMMPGMSGIALAEELGRLRPGLPILLTTGFSSEIAAAEGKRHRVLQKPYRSATLTAAIDEALG